MVVCCVPSAMPASSFRSYPRLCTIGRSGQAAVQALLLVVDHDGDTLLARIGIMRALNADGAEPEPQRNLVKRSRVIRGIARSPQKPKLR
jgi:hypothetical protein